jgi:hypothetical protein
MMFTAKSVHELLATRRWAQRLARQRVDHVAKADFVQDADEVALPDARSADVPFGDARMLSLRRCALSIVGFVTLVIAPSCGGGDNGSVDGGAHTDGGHIRGGAHGGTGAEMGSGVSCSTPPLAGVGDSVSFRRDVVPIFYKSCGADNAGCHSRVAYNPGATMDCRGWLSLEDVSLGSLSRRSEPTNCPDRPLYQRLIELTAWMCEPPRRYVTPGDTSSSLLYQVIAADPPGCAICTLQQTPLGRMPKAPLPPLDTASIKAIAAWIAAGAKDD